MCVILCTSETKRLPPQNKKGNKIKKASEPTSSPETGSVTNKSAGAPSTNRIQNGKWYKSAGTLVPILLALAILVLTPVRDQIVKAITEWYERPEVLYAYSNFDIAFAGGTDGTGQTHNLFTLRDNFNNCTLVKAEAIAAPSSLPPWSPLMQSVLLVMLRNDGRSSASDLNLIITGEKLDNPEVSSTPNISIESHRGGTTSPLQSMTIVVKSLPSKATAFITVRETIPQLSGTINNAANNETSLSLSGPLNRQVQLLRGQEASTTLSMQQLSTFSMLQKESVYYNQADLLMLPLPLPFDHLSPQVTWKSIDTGSPASCKLPAGPHNFRWTFKMTGTAH